MSPAAPRPRKPAGNPFATRHTRPGEVPYLFADANSIALLADQLAALQWRAAIVGPHGSGKTTLLAQLLPECARRGRRVQRFTLHDGQRRLPPHDRHWQRDTLVVVDGYEQLSWWSRQTLNWCCRRRAGGLLVTCHRPAGLPVLYQTSADLDRVQRIVALLTASTASAVTPEDVRAAFRAQQGNVREILFTLYDVHQSRT